MLDSARNVRAQRGENITHVSITTIPGRWQLSARTEGLATGPKTPPPMAPQASLVSPPGRR